MTYYAERLLSQDACEEQEMKNDSLQKCYLNTKRGLASVEPRESGPEQSSDRFVISLEVLARMGIKFDLLHNDHH